jgi:diguanylate cyclase (GGDEF)-like protein
MLPCAWLAGVAFYVINSGLTSVAFALANRTPIHDQLRQDVAWQLASSVMLLGLAPVVAQAVLWSPALLPFLLLPLVVVHHSAGLAARREHEALHDALTGLPNRGLLHATMQRALESDRDDVALMLIDLDHFKDVNDTLGHPIGDQLIRAVGARLREHLSGTEVLARLGGDEFAVVARHVGGVDGAATLAEHITATLREPVEVDGLALQVGGSVGIALAPDHGDTVDALLQRADVAMYAAKESRGSFAFYDPAHDTHSVQRLVLVSDFRSALAAGEIWVAFQPQIEPSSQEVLGAEALVRWSHPTLGPVDPERVVNLAASAGLMSELTSEVLEQGLAALARWRELGHELRLSVNLTARQLTDATLPGRITWALERHGIPASSLVLEVTESTLMLDAGRSLAVVGRLKGLGIELSIDDFGTGYSSMSHLQRLAPHEIKIDRTFVTDMLTNTADATIVRSTLELGHSLGMRVVAEGVEDVATAITLTDWGCDLLQGYGFARPAAEAELTAWLTTRRLTRRPRFDLLTFGATAV